MFPGKRDNKIKSKYTNVSETWGKWQTAGILQITAFFNAHQNNFNMATFWTSVMAVALYKWSELDLYFCAYSMPSTSFVTLILSLFFFYVCFT